MYYLLSFAEITLHTCTDVEFDNIVAEWLRFVKQRDKRDKNKENIEEES